jgi:uncharacterized protein (DUF1800 family)
LALILDAHAKRALEVQRRIGNRLGNLAPNNALLRRVLWASRAAGRYEQGLDPADLAVSCLGAYARPETVTALRRASSASQGVALLLMSPEFQRR